MAFCHNCGTQLPDGSAFCGKCGAELEAQPKKKTCPNCKNELDEGMMFCDKCGAKYATPMPASSRPHALPSAPQPVSHQSAPQNTYANGRSCAPVAHMGTLKVLSSICILLALPVGICGFVFLSRAKKSATQKDADDAILNGTRVCGVTIGIMGVMAIFILIMVLVTS